MHLTIYGLNDHTFTYAVAQNTNNDLITLEVSTDNQNLKSFKCGHDNPVYTGIGSDWPEGSID